MYSFRNYVFKLTNKILWLLSKLQYKDLNVAILVFFLKGSALNSCQPHFAIFNFIYSIFND